MVWYGNSDQVKGTDFPHQNMLACYVVGPFFLPNPHHVSEAYVLKPIHSPICCTVPVLTQQTPIACCELYNESVCMHDASVELGSQNQFTSHNAQASNTD